MLGITVLKGHVKQAQNKKQLSKTSAKKKQFQPKKFLSKTFCCRFCSEFKFQTHLFLRHHLLFICIRPIFFHIIGDIKTSAKKK